MDAFEIPEGWPEGWVEFHKEDKGVVIPFKEPVCCHNDEVVSFTATFTWVPGENGDRCFVHTTEPVVSPAPEDPDYENDDVDDEFTIPGKCYVGRIDGDIPKMTVEEIRKHFGLSEEWPG
jgi:hypothetical protein